MIFKRKSKPRTQLAASLGLLLGACAGEVALDPDGNDIESQAEVSFEDFLASCTELDGGMLCQGDMHVGAGRDPYEFWSTYVARPLGQSGEAAHDHDHPTPAGVGVSIEGLSRRGTQSDANLTYCVRNTSPNGFNASQHTAVRGAITAAANIWAPHVTVRYQHVPAEDALCDGTNTRVDFHVRAMTSGEMSARPNIAAFAFFPGESRSERGLAVRAEWIPSSNNTGFSNLMAHELGHTLGFVHEQYRDPTTGCQDTSNAGTPLTRYDARSIMHYQECNGRNFGGLSTYDMRGAQCAYLGNCEWIKQPGTARDIGAGSSNTIWIIGSSGTPYRFDWATNTWLVQPGGNGARIAVDSTGIAWMVNTSNSIYRWTPALSGGSWTKMPGAAIDIAVGGSSDSVWIVGTNGRMYRWNGSAWVIKDSGSNGWRIAVGSDGRPWMINTSGSIYVENGNGWLKQPGTGNDIGAGRDGSIWLVGSGSVSGGFGLYQYVPSTGGTSVPSWTKITGGGVNITAGGFNGTPWMVNDAGSIYRNRWE